MLSVSSPLRRREGEDDRQAVGTWRIAGLREAWRPNGLEECLRRCAVRRACSREEERVGGADTDKGSSGCIGPGQVADGFVTAVRADVRPACSVGGLDVERPAT